MQKLIAENKALQDSLQADARNGQRVLLYGGNVPTGVAQGVKMKP